MRKRCVNIQHINTSRVARRGSCRCAGTEDGIVPIFARHDTPHRGFCSAPRGAGGGRPVQPPKARDDGSVGTEFRQQEQPTTGKFRKNNRQQVWLKSFQPGLTDLSQLMDPMAFTIIRRLASRRRPARASVRRALVSTMAMRMGGLAWTSQQGTPDDGTGRPPYAKDIRDTFPGPSQLAFKDHEEVFHFGSLVFASLRPRHSSWGTGGVSHAPPLAPVVAAVVAPVAAMAQAFADCHFSFFFFLLTVFPCRGAATMVACPSSPPREHFPHPPSTRRRLSMPGVEGGPPKDPRQAYPWIVHDFPVEPGQAGSAATLL